MTQLKEFMLLFRYEPTNEQPTPDQLQAMKKYWGDYISNVAMQGKLVSTHQLGFEGKKLYADQSAKDGMAMAEGKIIGGNMILKSESLNDAAELAKKCPILKMGGTVEVRDIIPM